ncbi:hypothetical protein Tco_1218863 [Tanacetum coccineum]
MAVLESCPKHNMVAYLKKTEGNAEFHKVLDFLTRSSIHHALTVSLVVSTTFVETIWMSAKSKIDLKCKILYLIRINIFREKSHLYLLHLLVQSIEDECATSERPSEPQPTPSPPHPSEANVEPQSDPSPRPSPTPHIPDSIPEVSGGNQGGQSSSDRSLSGTEGGMTLQSVYDLCISLCTQVTDQAKEIKHLKAQIKKLKKQAKPVITHHRAWMKSVSLKQRLAGKKSLKSNWMQKESVSKQGRKSAKAEPSVHKDPLFDELDDDEIDNMDIEDVQDVGRTRNGVNAEKEGTEDAVSTDKEKVSTDRSKDSTDKEKDSTDKEKEEDDETIAQVLLNMSQAKAVSREKEKGLKKKFNQLARDEEMARKLQEDWETKEERKRLAEEEATKTALSDEYDFIQARIEADRLLALRLQDEEREQFTVEERAKFLHDTIAGKGVLKEFIYDITQNPRNPNSS